MLAARRVAAAAAAATAAAGHRRVFAVTRQQRLQLSSVAARAAAAAVAMAPATTAEAYADLAKRLREIDALGGVQGLLGWDELVLLPEGAQESRAAQKEALAGVLHDKKTSPELGELLSKLQAADAAAQLTPVQAAVVREAARSYKRTTAISKELAQRAAKLESAAYNAWVKARQAADWKAFEPYLQQWVDVSREKAAAIDPTRDAYDVLLEDYEKGVTARRLDEVFGEVRASLVPLLAELREKGTPPDAAWISGSFDVDKQAQLCKEVALALGFDESKGRLDKSVHPFTGGTHPTDVRMTTRYKEGDLTESLTGTIHETGHALYEQGRNLSAEWAGLPVNEPTGMATHESQSLLWERMVGLGRPFAAYLLPKLAAAFPDVFEGKTPEDLYRAFSVIKTPSLIRVEADEVTYPLHVILRYEIERGLIDGSVAVADVPRLWNSKMQSYLGVAPKDDAQGCLQDVHWSSGALGYFPTYSLGAMMARQIYDHAAKQLPGLDADISKGEFARLRKWLNEHIHAQGSLYASGDELLEAVTGAKLDATSFVEGYLRPKYAEIYKLPSAAKAK